MYHPSILSSNRRDEREMSYRENAVGANLCALASTLAAPKLVLHTPTHTHVSLYHGAVTARCLLLATASQATTGVREDSRPGRAKGALGNVGALTTAVNGCTAAAHGEVRRHSGAILMRREDDGSNRMFHVRHWSEAGHITARNRNTGSAGRLTGEGGT